MTGLHRKSLIRLKSGNLKRKRRCKQRGRTYRNRLRRLRLSDIIWLVPGDVSRVGLGAQHYQYPREELRRLV